MVATRAKTVSEGVAVCAPFRALAGRSSRGPIVVERPEALGALVRSVVELAMVAVLFAPNLAFAAYAEPRWCAAASAVYVVAVVLGWGLVQCRSDRRREFLRQRSRVWSVFRSRGTWAAIDEAERVLRSRAARWRWLRSDFARARYAYATLWLIAGDAEAFVALSRGEFEREHGLWAACLRRDADAWRAAIDARAPRSAGALCFGLAAGRLMRWSTEGRIGDDSSVDQAITDGIQEALLRWASASQHGRDGLDPWETQCAAVGLRWLDERGDAGAVEGIDVVRAWVSDGIARWDAPLLPTP